MLFISPDHDKSATMLGGGYRYLEDGLPVDLSGDRI